MFQGRYFHTIDPKGRLSIPAKFREVLAEREEDTLIVVEADGCLWAYPQGEWERFVGEIRRRPQLSAEMRNFLRIFASSAKECPVDRAGRILVAPEHREFAGLVKDVVLVGTLDRFEIWGRERWADFYQRQGGTFEQIAEKLGALGL